MQPERYRILIIDDDAGLRKTLADILRVNGYELLEAADGVQGLALQREHAINLVLLDLGLPFLSGLDVLNRIKEECPAAEVIILTGNATFDSAIEATNRGAFSYLLKPYDIDQLLLHVRRAIEKQQAELQIVRHSAELRRINAELQTLYRISLATSSTIELQQLIVDLLQALAKTDLFYFETKGAIFLCDGDELRLASQIGLSEADLAPCREIRMGECLCGLAAATGNTVVSEDSDADARHTRSTPGAGPHGHLVVPLKAAGSVVGVLNLYIQPGTRVSEQQLTLFTAIGSQVGIAINNARLYEEARSVSLHDPLTGLANRRFLDIQLTKCFDAARRYGEKIAVIMLDIDYFKAYNDAHGHQAGDRLLVEVAGILLRETRGADYLFRYGGEEFLLILPWTDTATATETADRLRRAVEDEAGVTISLGVASCMEGIGGKESLISRADDALYRAKRNGRNRVELGGEG